VKLFLIENVKKNVRIAISSFASERGMIKLENNENHRMMSYHTCGYAIIREGKYIGG